jgi:hypothetical protein
MTKIPTDNVTKISTEDVIKKPTEDVTKIPTETKSEDLWDGAPNETTSFIDPTS